MTTTYHYRLTDADGRLVAYATTRAAGERFAAVLGYAVTISMMQPVEVAAGEDL